MKNTVTTPSSNVIRVGTRGSRLALIQTSQVIASLVAKHTGFTFETVVVKTAGDRDKVSPVKALGVGVFIKQLETALRNGVIDLAIHSFKDLPSQLDYDMMVAATPQREDARDVLVNRWNTTLMELPNGANIGTSSPRRQAQILSKRSDLNIKPMRGNVDTRILKANAGVDYDGTILAAAGLVRLGCLPRASEILDPAHFVPAVGQGALAVEVLASETRAIRLAQAINHNETNVAVTAERAFLAWMGGGCNMPLGAHGHVENGRLTLRGFVSNADGTRTIRRTTTGSVKEASETGRYLAKQIADEGGKEILMSVVELPPANNIST